MTRTARSATVQRGDLGLEAAEGFPENPDEGKVVVWAVNPAANLPGPRDDATGWSANGALYAVGGASAEGPQRETFWAIPTTAGDLPEWKRLEVSDLPYGLSGGTRHRHRPQRDHHRRRASRGSGADEPSGERRAAEPVLPAGSRRCDGAGAQDRR